MKYGIHFFSESIHGCLLFKMPFKNECSASVALAVFAERACKLTYSCFGFRISTKENTVSLERVDILANGSISGSNEHTGWCKTTPGPSLPKTDGTA